MKAESSPLVSILVPCYNAGPFLAECLQSAVGQSHGRLEVIVVDDGSTDESLAVARTFESDRVKVLVQENGGQAAALNTAMGQAQGDYLQFLDADDLLHGDKIAIQIARLRDAGPESLASCAWGRFRGSHATARFVAEHVWRDLDPVEWLVASWTGGGMMPLTGWLVPRSVAVRAGAWDATLRWAANLDAHFTTKALLASSGAYFCPGAKVYYRSGHASMSRWNTLRSLEASLRVLVETGDLLLSREDSPRTRSACADMLQRFIYSAYPRADALTGAAERRIADLGGSLLPVEGGERFRQLAAIVGWKVARRVQIAVASLRNRSRLGGWVALGSSLQSGSR